MTTTTFRAAAARVRTIDWRNVAARAANGARLCWTAAQLLAAALVLAAEVIHEHREQIRDALVAAIAAIWVAAEATYWAGGWLRRAVDRVAESAAALVHEQPVPALAPITAGLAGAWQLVRWCWHCGPLVPTRYAIGRWVEFEFGYDPDSDELPHRVARLLQLSGY
jgi:hypothetical protein